MGKGSSEKQLSAAHWKVSEENVSRRGNCVQLCRDSQESRDWT